MDIAAKIGAATIALALVCAHPGTALAAGVDNPVDRVTGDPLPLEPYEKLHLTADGKCGVIAAIDETFDKTKFTWQGACRFGLAHGWGYLIDAADGKAFWLQFTYGWRDTGLTLPTGYTKIFRNNRNFGGDFITVNFSGMDHFDPARYYDNVAAVRLETRAGPTYVSEFVGFRNFLCPFKSGFSDAPNYKPSKQQISLAKKACSKREDGTTGHFIFLSRITQVRDGAGTWLNNGPVVEDVRVCEYASSIKGVPSCSEEASLAAGPMMDRITAVMAADKTAVMDRRKELIRRFAPLEMAWRAKIAGFAAR